jgi:hypothetical protein
MEADRKTSTGTSVDEQGSSRPPRRRERRPRTGKKRLKFSPPERFPRGVRELWQAASPSEQEQAHRTCVQILSMWLGKRDRQSVSSELSIPPLRVWQLSQQALSGMLAGLLRQPRARRRPEEMTMEERADDPRVLKRRIAELERDLGAQRELLQLLSSLPKPGSGPPDSTTSAPSTSAAKYAGKRRMARKASGRDGVAVQQDSAAR